MADVKLLRPQRLTDNPDGGGLATSTEVVDGQVNNLFDDISRIDRVNGELSLRKVFIQAATADTALYSDVHAIVQAPPQDPRVAAVMFRTGVWGDERADAQSAVERYLDESVITRMIPYDRQLQGQRTVLVYQRPELALPEIGEVYALKNDTAATVEFLRIQDVDHQVETFTDSAGDFRARVITLTISQPLSREFGGSQPNRFFTVDVGKSVIRKTIASDAARYKGVVSLAQDAQAGDLTVKLETVFAQLVPAATSEVAVVDAEPAGAVVQVAAASEAVVVSLGAMSIDDGKTETRYVLGSVTPGTLILQRDGNAWNRRDDGKGNLIDVALGNQVCGAVDYQTGQLTLNDTDPSAGSTWAANTATATYMPAATVASSALSHQIPVQIQNRGYVYVATLRPAPAPGSVVVSYRALGRWYELRDDGTGALVGDAGVGTGQVNFQTGSVQVTLGALPDIGSAVIIAYAGSSTFEIRDADIAIKVPGIEIDLSAQNCEPGTLSVSWLAGGVLKTATDNGSGVLSGDATGSVLYGTGRVFLRPSLLPDSNTEYTVDYQAGTTSTETFNPSLSGGSVTLQLGALPKQGSLTIEYSGSATTPFGAATASTTLRDNGLGQLVDPQGGVVAGSSVNYGTGAVTFNPNFITQGRNLQRATYSAALPARTVNPTTGRYEIVGGAGLWSNGVTNAFFEMAFASGGAMVARYKAATASDTARHDVVPAKPLTVDLVPLVSNGIVPGGLIFVLGGKTYYERSGTLYHTMSASNGAGTAAGTVDYAGGKATLTAWTGNIAPAFDVKALLTQVAALPVAIVHGRTPGSPLRPGTFYLQANRYDTGALISALADNNGNMQTADMHGSVDVTTGVFAVGFGGWVLDSSLTTQEKAESWYSASNVDAEGYIWRPREVMPGTVRFNCVVQASLPQDPEIIKVNPVRLPMDGRVQVIRPGDTLVIHDTQPHTLPNPLSAGQVVTLPRNSLASVAVYDASGFGVDPLLYTADLTAGTLTWDTPLDLSAYQQPLVALHTVEDMALCLDAQITGDVSLGQALSRGYSAANSYCSSALVLGDAQARYATLFAQATWTNVWSDSRIGSAPASGAQYNDGVYPIEVLNRDAITQRWALIFTSATAFNIVGEELGVVGTGTTGAAVAPMNPATGQPYFQLQAAGFGSGWSTGNVIRFNTVAAGGPVWVARTVRSGPATQLDDLIRLQTRWDKD